MREFSPGKYSIFSAEQDESCGDDDEDGGGGGDEEDGLCLVTVQSSALAASLVSCQTLMTVRQRRRRDRRRTNHLFFRSWSRLWQLRMCALLHRLLSSHPSALLRHLINSHPSALLHSFVNHPSALLCHGQCLARAGLAAVQPEPESSWCWEAMQLLCESPLTRLHALVLLSDPQSVPGSEREGLGTDRRLIFLIVHSQVD